MTITDVLSEAARRTKARSDADLSRRIGVSPSMITRLRKGKTQLQPSHIPAFYDYADMPIDLTRSLLAQEKK